MIATAKAMSYDYSVLVDGLVPTELAQRIQTSTTILVSEYSHDAGKQLAEVIPGAEVILLDQSSHEMTPANLANTIKEVPKKQRP